MHQSCLANWQSIYNGLRPISSLEPVISALFAAMKVNKGGQKAAQGPAA
jgi:hypothetical protein